jgi:hypothetical protein
MAKGAVNTCGKLNTAAASVNATLLSSVPVDIYHIMAVNTSAAVKYLKLYNLKVSPASTDTPIMVIALSPTNVLTNVPIPTGVYFNQGLGYRLTGAAADSDATALTAGDVVGLNILYT